MRPTLVLLLPLLTLCARPAAGQADPRYARYLADARRHLGRQNGARAARSFVQALDVNPRGVEALVGLAGLNRQPARETLLLQAFRLSPRDAKVLAALGRTPKLLAEGKATRLLAAYLGHCERDSAIGQAPSLGLGQPLRRDLLVVHGLDAAGNLVPVEVALSGSAEFDDELAPRRASARARLTVKDRKSGNSVELPLRLIGPVHRLRLWTRDTRVGSGEMLHLGVGLYDAAGNRIWAPKLKWLATQPNGAAHPELLERVTSQVHRDITFEPHRNIVRGPKGERGYRGKLTVEAVEPASGKSDRVAIEVIQGKAISRPSLAGLSWAASFEKAAARAKKTGKALMILFYADW